MSSTIASSPTVMVSEADMDLDIDIEDDVATAASTPTSNAHDELKGLESSKMVENQGDVDQNVFNEPPDVSMHANNQSKSPPEDLQARLTRLDILLQKSAVYSRVLGERMNKSRRVPKGVAEVTTDESTQASAARAKSNGGRNKKAQPRDAESEPSTGSKRGLRDVDEASHNRDMSSPTKRLKTDVEAAALESFDEEQLIKQPDAITGAILKDYQLLGVAWLVSLWENGVNGILADEMGLGKTLQTIAFLAHVRQHGAANNTLIVCPLSVLHNWVDEFEKFAPKLPVCMYHGTPTERAEIRRTVMRQDLSSPKKALPKKSSKQVRDEVLLSKTKEISSQKQAQLPTRSSKRHRQVPISYAESDDSDSHGDAEGRVAFKEEDADSPRENEYNVSKESDRGMDEPPTLEEAPRNTLPIVLTTYEMIIKDRQHLAKYKWNFIIVDEGHRLKNMDCRLMQEIKKYESANRLILTGTPLHNNLAELWSLLNFILPDIFQDLDSFQEWFNLPTLQNTLPSTQSSNVISKLHGILKPFLLRRLKVDVEQSLPPKKEYVLYAPLSERQREVYDAILNGALRGYLINDKRKELAKPDNIKREDKGRSMRKRTKVSYRVDGDDDEWFEKLEEGEFNIKDRKEQELDAGRQFHYRETVKQVNSMKLQNTVMQLRKVCSHPFLFDWPLDPVTRDPVVDDQLVNASGKMMILDRLLDELFQRGHKVLLFSQFTTMLDLVEEWAVSFKQWETCRIDGSTEPMERRAEMHRFQNGGNDPQAPWLFLLSTRAGGLGINLTAADTVIFYDQDWNPQMDLQAMDRAHRIGQKKPVLVFRLISAHTVETKIMQRATEKRKLEALVIAKGKFRMPGSTSRTKGQTVAEMAASLLKLEGEKIEVVPNSEVGKAKVISDADLEKLLDRSPGVFAGRGQGWTSGSKVKDRGEETDVAFEVFQAPVDECNDGLAAMMGEKIE